MVTLAVHPADLEHYGALVSRVGTAAKKAQSYVDEHGADFGGISGRIWTLITGSHDRAIGAVDKMLRHLEDISSTSNRGLRNAAKYYRATEHSTAARVDATYPERRSTPSDRDLTMSHYQDLTGMSLATHNFADASDALATLTEPETAELGPFQKFVNNPGGVFDYLSPSNAACKVIELLIGHDPIEWFLEWFDGDWKKCYECGGALENVGKMMGAISINTVKGANELHGTWSGNAADAAWEYFDGFSEAAGEQQEVLSQLGERYKITAMGICRLQETAAGIIKGMIDAALIASAAAAGGAATAETGAGAAVGGIISGVEAARIWEMWERLKMIPEKATQVGNGFVGFVQTSASKTADFAKHPLPKSGYKPPMKAA
ncbi:hypothetical protein [Actinoallomurus sp. NPDC052274]|uniref:hypothetical protein n=1 Tax=Actinoallomurus sp. NPDC052274 TaxID=3155420 RepID=UPI00341631A0